MSIDPLQAVASGRIYILSRDKTFYFFRYWRDGWPLSPLPSCVSRMDHSTIIGALAAVCSVTSFLPQAWRIVKTRDTAAISAPMYALTIVGFGLWVTYGLSYGSGRSLCRTQSVWSLPRSSS